MQRLRERLAGRPELFLFLLAAAMPLAFRSWQALLNNFAIERAGFTGVEIGILQSLREIPGLLAFTVVFVLLLVREQTLAVVSLIVLGTMLSATPLSAFMQKFGRRAGFFLGTLGGAIGAGVGAVVFGIPLALAAFVAGLVIADSPMAGEARRRLLPFRDVFAVLFFVRKANPYAR